MSARPGAGRSPVGRPAFARKPARAVERAFKLERAWFNRHDARAHWLRPALPHRSPGVRWFDGAARLALAKQVLLGTCIRLALRATWAVCAGIRVKGACGIAMTACAAGAGS